MAGPHAVVAARLLDLALGPFRARGIVASDDAAHDRRLASVRAAATEAGIEAAHAVPLVAHGDVIGLFAVYPPLGRELTSDQSALLGALAGQIAVAVQNARLHEETKLLGIERERALDAERVAARRLSALYEISRSFAQSLSLDSTLDAVARTLVELLEVDAAVIRLPDERGESLVAQAVHVSSPQLQQAVHAIFDQPDPVVASAARRRLAEGRPVRLDPGSAEELGRSHRLLVPFLERGSTAAVIPIATPSELLATLTLVSLDPRRPLTDETIDTALTVAAQAALAVDNARLYQQQKAFTDSMQRSLLPRTRPRMAGLEIGAIYESSALVGVGGDIYDYLQTGDDRLAIVLGDVTGHGIDAAADMAMAKFVFRSLARLYPEPGAFLGAANDVVVEEIGAGKFITMLYLTIDLARGEVACASAGHPPPRLLDAERRRHQPRREGSRPRNRAGHRVHRAPAAVPARRLGRPLHRRPRRGAPGRRDVRRGTARPRARREPRATARAARRGRARGVPPLGRGRPPRRLRDRRRAAYVKLLKADGRPFRVGHKGAAALEPENTLRSLRRGVELGCDLIEFDVLDLHDGTLVLAHSDDLLEVSHGAAAGRVREQTLDSLREVAPELPTFDEALELLGGMAGVGLHVDLKWHGYEDAAAEAIRRHGLVERSVVSSFHAASLRRLARRRAGARARVHVPVRPAGRLAPPDAGAGRRHRGRRPARGAARAGRQDARAVRARERADALPLGRVARRRSSALTRAALRSSRGP